MEVARNERQREVRGIMATKGREDFWRSYLDRDMTCKNVKGVVTDLSRDFKERYMLVGPCSQSCWLRSATIFRVVRDRQRISLRGSEDEDLG
jgi:hypothetical protein